MAESSASRVVPSVVARDNKEYNSPGHWFSKEDDPASHISHWAAFLGLLGSAGPALWPWNVWMDFVYASFSGIKHHMQHPCWHITSTGGIGILPVDATIGKVVILFDGSLCACLYCIQWEMLYLICYLPLAGFYSIWGSIFHCMSQIPLCHIGVSDLDLGFHLICKLFLWLFLRCYYINPSWGWNFYSTIVL